MQSLTARIASFQPPARRTKNAKPTWAISPSTHPRLTPEKLAEAGFFYNPSVEEPDNCQCFSCGLQLGGWDEDDDPFVEQCKRFDCAWGELVCAPRVARDKDEIIMTVADEALLPSSSASTQTRIRTFHGQSGESFWPHKPRKSWKPSVENVAAAGFVYQDAPDYVMCPYCQYTIGDWEAADDPLSIHQSRKPNCPFFTISLETPASLKASTKSAPKPRAPRGKRAAAATPASVAGSVMGDEEDIAEPSEPAKKGRKARGPAAKPAAAKGRGKKVGESEVAESVIDEEEEGAETRSVAAEVDKPKGRGRQTKKTEERQASQPAAILEDVQEVAEPPKKEGKPRATKASRKADADALAEAVAEATIAEEEPVLPIPEAEPGAIAEDPAPTPISKPSKPSKPSRAPKATKPPSVVAAPIPAPTPAPAPAPKSRPAPSVAPSPSVPSKSSRPIKSLRAAKLEKSLAASAAASVPPPAAASSSSRSTAPSSKPPSSKPPSSTISKPLPPTPKDAPRSQPLNQLAQYANIPPTSPMTHDREPSRQLLDSGLEQAAKAARQVVLDLAPSRTGDGSRGKGEEGTSAEDEALRVPLTAEERKMTVEQFIARQLSHRAQAMEEEGEEMIRRFKEEGGVVRGQIVSAFRS